MDLKKKIQQKHVATILAQYFTKTAEAKYNLTDSFVLCWKLLRWIYKVIGVLPVIILFPNAVMAVSRWFWRNSKCIWRIRRWPWCNGYCRRIWTRQHEFKSWTRLIAELQNCRRCLWCNGYCHRQWTQVQILDETDFISHCTNTLEKGMNPIILRPAIVGQTDFFSLGEATSLGEGKLWIQTC